MQLVNSIAWALEPGEDMLSHTDRKIEQTQHFNKTCRERGSYYVIKIDANTTIGMWEDEIGINELREKIAPGSARDVQCPLCQPYDHRNAAGVIERRYLCRIVKPEYEAFLDTGGVFAPCACISKGRAREMLKFRKCA